MKPVVTVNWKCPTDTVTLLRNVALVLDDVDRQLTAIAQERGQRWDLSTEMQDDVRRLAEWFQSRPDLDVAAFHAVTHGWDNHQLPPDPATVIQQLRALANKR